MPCATFSEVLVGVECFLKVYHNILHFGDVEDLTWHVVDHARGRLEIRSWWLVELCSVYGIEGEGVKCQGPV